MGDVQNTGQACTYAELLVIFVIFIVVFISIFLMPYYGVCFYFPFFKICL